MSWWFTDEPSAAFLGGLIEKTADTSVSGGAGDRDRVTPEAAALPGVDVFSFDEGDTPYEF